MSDLFDYKEVFEIIDRVFTELGIEYYLIGAQARDYHLIKNGIAPIRLTRDIDFAVMLPEMKIYDDLKIILIHSGFLQMREPYRLIHDGTKTIIDLLPFGVIEEDGKITLGNAETIISVVGMKEVSEFTLIATIDDMKIRISSLEGLVILKLISFSEKPERRKDLDDISEILKNYFDINQSRFYSEHLDVIDEIESNNFMLLAGARLMGRDMKVILLLSEKLLINIKNVIQNELIETPGTITNYFLSKNIFKDYFLIKNIFIQLLKGINE